jgi:hypothetical protein
MLAQQSPAAINSAPIKVAPITPAVSPLMLSDRLISLAQDADRAGLRAAADRLVRLACDVLDPPRPH